MRTDLSDIIADLFHRIEVLERRVQNKNRKGKVVEVDAEKGLARVELNDDPGAGKPYLGPWMPWKMPAMGATKVNIPPSVGQQVEVTSESGDLTDGIIESSLRSNDNPQPDAQPGEAIVTTGSTEFFIGPNGVRTKTGTFEIEANVKIKGNIEHTGNTNQTGVHIDSNGRHRA